MKMQSKSYGYYDVSISLPNAQRLLRTNDERAFVVSQLQDLLSPRLLIGSIPAYAQLASCIDLLAFSITSTSIQFLVFSIDISILSQFTNHLSARLSQYQYEYRRPDRISSLDPQIHIKKLRGPHHALARTVELHMSHEDWEYDRYSSVGFYLHDRRGDWMRTWRLAQLYNNDATNYRLLIEKKLGTQTSVTQSILRSFAS